MRFVAVGEAMLDVLAAPVPGTRHGRITVRAGGTAVNAALAAAAAGAEAAVVSRVGDDLPASLLREELEAASVEPLLRVDASRPTGCFVRLGDEIAANRGASACIAAADLDGVAADVVLVSGYTLLNPDTAEAATAALALSAWTGADAGSVALAGRAESLGALAAARVVFADEEEGETLTGRTGAEAARALAERCEFAFVKLGAGGAVAATGTEAVALPAIAIDADAPFVGAGDALDAAVLLALARGAGLEDALAAGTTAAARWLNGGSR